MVAGGFLDLGVDPAFEFVRRRGDHAVAGQVGIQKREEAPVVQQPGQPLVDAPDPLVGPPPPVGRGSGIGGVIPSVGTFFHEALPGAVPGDEVSEPLGRTVGVPHVLGQPPR